jgi:hypothetical protein
MIEIIDNFLDKESFNAINSALLGKDAVFPWYFNLVVATDDDTSLDNFQFTHVFYNNLKSNSQYNTILAPLIDKLEIRSLIRIKANLVTKTEKIIEHGFHVDYPYPDSKTSVFYVNTNNGYTKFDDGSIVNSVENRVATFNSTLPHTGSSCTDSRARVVINLNYF